MLILIKLRLGQVGPHHWSGNQALYYRVDKASVSNVLDSFERKVVGDVSSRVQGVLKRLHQSVLLKRKGITRNLDLIAKIVIAVMDFGSLGCRQAHYKSGNDFLVESKVREYLVSVCYVLDIFLFTKVLFNKPHLCLSFHHEEPELC